MHHKTELRKGLATVAVDGPAAPGDRDQQRHRQARRHPAHPRRRPAIAYLRFDRADGDMRAGAATLRRVGDDRQP